MVCQQLQEVRDRENVHSYETNIGSPDIVMLKLKHLEIPIIKKIK